MNLLILLFPALVNRFMNVVYTDWTGWKNAGFDKNSTFSDPMFQDPSSFEINKSPGNLQLKENLDFTLLANSPALKFGFKQIESKFGVQNK